MQIGSLLGDCCYRVWSSEEAWVCQQIRAPGCKALHQFRNALLHDFSLLWHMGSPNFKGSKRKLVYLETQIDFTAAEPENGTGLMVRGLGFRS